MPKLKIYNAQVYSMTEAELLKYYKQVAKNADRRLRNLEKLAEEKDYKVADKWAYSAAMRDIHKWSGDTAKRFDTAPPPNKRDLQKKITEIENFLNAPTSSKTGIKQSYQKKSDTYKEKYGINLSWSQVGDFFESEGYKKLDEKGYGSKTIMISIGYMQKYGDAIKEMLEEAISDEVHVSKDDEPDMVELALHDLNYSEQNISDIMAYMYAEEPDPGEIIRAAEIMGITLPGVRKDKNGEGYTKQDIRNLKNMAKDRDIVWEDLLN